MSERIRDRKLAMIILLGASLLVGIAACGHMGMQRFAGGHVERPAEEEFGFGPRSSPSRMYRATLEPDEPIQVRRMQTMRLVVVDSAGHAVDGAEIRVGGGMPEHGHGLPTQPKVTRSLGAGVYEVEGVRFNMGGWWEVKFAIHGRSGADTVTFNLDL